MLRVVVPVQVTAAKNIYKFDFFKWKGLFDWFNLDFPMTADKVRMAAADSVVEEAGKTIEVPKLSHFFIVTDAATKLECLFRIILFRLDQHIWGWPDVFS